MVKNPPEKQTHKIVLDYTHRDKEPLSVVIGGDVPNIVYITEDDPPLVVVKWRWTEPGREI